MQGNLRDGQPIQDQPDDLALVAAKCIAGRQQLARRRNAAEPLGHAYDRVGQFNQRLGFADKAADSGIQQVVDDRHRGLSGKTQ